MNTVYLMRITRGENAPAAYCQEHFPKRLQRAERFRFAEDRWRCITAGILLYEVLGLKEETIRFNSYGKPYAEQGPSFSLSHSGDCVALAVGDRLRGDAAVGVDIECVDRKFLSVMPAAFTEEEIRYTGEDRFRFYSLWTLKESLSKAVGTGLGMGFREVSVLPMLEGKAVPYEGICWYGNTRRIDGDGKVLSLVSQQKEDGIHIVREPETVEFPEA